MKATAQRLSAAAQGLRQLMDEIKAFLEGKVVDTESANRSPTLHNDSSKSCSMIGPSIEARDKSALMQRRFGRLYDRGGFSHLNDAFPDGDFFTTDIHSEGILCRSCASNFEASDSPHTSP